MSEKYTCPLCSTQFTTARRLQSHLKRKNPCVNLDDNSQKKIIIEKKNLLIEPEILMCQYCNKKIARKDNLNRHLAVCRFRNSSNENNALVQLQEEMAHIKYQLNEKGKQLEKQKKQIEELKAKPTNINNNNLQIVCVRSIDNYLDMLTDRLGNFDRALDYIKDCALSSLTGDCKLIEKIYLDNLNSPPSISYADKKKTKIQYYNENKQITMESKDLFGRKLANNLQNSYLKGVNHLITNNLQKQSCPNKFLEEYDLQAWNQHIFDLSDLRYHHNGILYYDIPIK